MLEGLQVDGGSTNLSWIDWANMDSRSPTKFKSVPHFFTPQSRLRGWCLPRVCSSKGRLQECQKAKQILKLR